MLDSGQVWSNSSRCRQESVYLSRTWCLYTWSCLDNLIIIRFSINCSTVICSPTIILMLSWEKPLVKPMAPGSIFYHISFQSTFICIFNFPIYIIKYQKYIYVIILSLSDLTFASGREGIDNPFIALVASSLFVCVGAWDFWGASHWIDTLVLKNWGNTYGTIAASPFPLQGKPTQAQDVALGTGWKASPKTPSEAGKNLRMISGPISKGPMSGLRMQTI